MINFCNQICARVGHRGGHKSQKDTILSKQTRDDQCMNEHSTIENHGCGQYGRMLADKSTVLGGQLIGI